MGNLILNYLVYIVYFLEMGLVSSGIVLMPFNMMRYSLILVIGLILFISGTIFKESPNYVSYLIPIGIVVSSISFTVKNNYKLNKQSKIKLGIALLIVALAIHLTLSFFSSSMIGNGGDIFNNMNNMHK